LSEFDRLLLLTGKMSMTDGIQLLRNYAERGDEAAFRELVERYINLVYSVAIRRVGGDADLARDVAQTVFTDLARKARSLGQVRSLGGWLHRHTGFVAATVVRRERSRHARERQAVEMNTLHDIPDSTWQQLAPVLDETIDALDAADREAIVLRFFEQHDLREVGAALGISDDAAQKRVSRAIEKLRVLLAQRGVSLGVTVLASLMIAQAVSAAPIGLGASVSQTALVAAASGAGITLALGKLFSSVAFKVTLGMTAVAVVSTCYFLVKHSTSNPKTKLARANSAAKQSVASISTPQNFPAVETNPISAIPPNAGDKLVLHIVANDTGNPIAGATVAFWVRENDATNRPLNIPTEITADKLGVCEISIPRDAVALLGVGSRTDEYVDTAFVWIPERGERIPQQYTLRLDNAAPIGGLVVDENGKPVAGANVTVETGGNSAPEDNPSPPHISTAATERAVTDAEGRWRIARFSKKGIAALNFNVAHPDYVSEMLFAYINENDPEITQSLLAGTYVHKLDRGVLVSGIVVDTEGQPVSGAKVVAISGGSPPRTTTNQSDGTFTLKGCRVGPSQINAEAHGFAQATVNVEITTNQTPLRLELRRGNLLRLRVVDTNGMPVTNATVSLNFNPTGANRGQAGGRYGSPGQFRKQTDAHGRITWDSAPEGPLFFGIHANGYEWAQNVQVKADGEEHLVTLHAAQTISGSVRDAATSQPISTFRIVTGEVRLPPSADGTNVDWGRSQTFRGGTFRFQDDNPGAGSKEYKFEADGYAPFVTRMVGPDEGDVSFGIVLYPAVATTITVLLPDGQPATNASIGLDIPGKNLDWILKPGGFSSAPLGSHNNVFSADDAGRFVLPPDDTVTRVIAASPDGYAESTPAALAAESTMRLQTWGRLEGTLLTGGKPAVGQVLSLGRSGPGAAMMGRFFSAETDADGHFAFPKVPPGQISLFQKYSQGEYHEYHPFQVPPVTVRLGETTTVSLFLYNVTARLSLPAGVDMETNWNMSAVALADGSRVSKSLKESGNGTWVAEGVAAGDYTLQASVLDSAPTGGVFKVRLQAKVSFTVPSDPPGGTLDLGEIILQRVQ
jgi:RNA polymerase sigma factor (sigma-70 family)